MNANEPRRARVLRHLSFKDDDGIMADISLFEVAEVVAVNQGICELKFRHEAVIKPVERKPEDVILMVDCLYVEFLPERAPAKRETVPEGTYSGVFLCLACQTMWPGNELTSLFCMKDSTMLINLGELPAPSGDDAVSELRLQGALQEYKVLTRDKISEGYSANVYRSSADETNLVPVAIKLLKSKMADPKKSVAAFLNEEQLLRSLDHPCIVKCIDSGIHDNDRPFLVLEYVDGEPLLTALKRRLSLEEIVLITQQVCEALIYLRNCDVVHPELKPADIMLMTDGTVKLIDFGSARPLGHIHGTQSEGGMFSGDANYTAPEIMTGKSATIASNVYSLGCIMFEMLTGSNPFYGETILQSARNHLNQKRPSLKQALPECPRRLDELVSAMLSINAGERPDVGILRMWLQEIQEITIDSHQSHVNNSAS